MSGLFIASPSAAPPAPLPPSPWHGIRVTWTGANGDWWSMTDLASGVILTNDGLRGFNMPPYTRYSDTSPAIDGSRYRGHVINERELFLPLAVYSDVSSAAWVAHNRAFWATLRPDALGTLTVTLPDATSRSIRARYVDDGDPSLTRDPVLTGYGAYGIKLVAEQPLWEGAPVSQGWGTLVGSSAFPEPGDGWVKRISKGSSVGAATITNPGDVGVYPIWTLKGPLTTAAVGASSPTVGAGQVQMTAPLAEGESLVIDPRPGRQSAVHSVTGENWVKIPGKIGAIDFNGSLIPPGQDWRLAIAAVGTGSVSASITPLYYRAF